MTILAVRLAWAFETRETALGLSGLWLISNLSYWFAPHPYSQFFPLVDYAACAVLALLWRNSLSPWKVALIGLLFADCCLHVIYATGVMRRFDYNLSLNMVYLAQLACVISPRLEGATAFR